jgi:hypothetical protein
LSRTNERGRSLVVVFFVVMAAAVALMMASSSHAWADTKCDRADFADDTGYLDCLTGGTGGGTGGVGGKVENSADEDLPVTGTSPVRTLVIGSAFIVVGAAAVAGSLQTRRRNHSIN